MGHFERVSGACFYFDLDGGHGQKADDGFDLWEGSDQTKQITDQLFC